MAAPRMQNDRPNHDQVAPRIGERERRRGRIAPLRRRLPYIVGAAAGLAIVCAVMARLPETALAATAAAASPPRERAAAAAPDQTTNHVFSALISRRVISSPPGAELLRRGAVLGTTPIELELTPSEAAEPVTLRLAGYLEQSCELMPDQPGATYVVLKRAPEPVFHERDCDSAPTPLAGRGEP